VPLEYSIARLTWVIASRLDAVMVAGRVLLKIVYLLTCRVLGVAVLVFRGGGAKDAELLVVRHEALSVPDGGGRPLSPCRRSGGVKLEAA
jgi:hypothetical protein